ncbi:hypothetical protein SLE2022_181870 [Rubroshorea leprosula]
MNSNEFSAVLSSSPGTLIPTTIDWEPICIPPDMHESYTRESSPIETPGSILLERTTADAAISDTMVAGIEHKCLQPTSAESAPLR